MSEQKVGVEDLLRHAMSRFLAVFLNAEDNDHRMKLNKYSMKLLTVYKIGTFSLHALINALYQLLFHLNCCLLVLLLNVLRPR